MSSNLVSNIGLFLTFIGVILSIYEYIWPYKGAQYNDERDPLIYGLDPAVDGGIRTETEQYKSWKKRRRRYILIGLFVTAIGILMQIL